MEVFKCIGGSASFPAEHTHAHTHTRTQTHAHTHTHTHTRTQVRVVAGCNVVGEYAGVQVYRRV